MKFRSKLINADLFLKVVQTLEKTDKECVMHLSPRKIQWILTSDVTEGVQVWSGMNALSLFSDYTIQSLNNNHIGLRLQFAHLHKTLASANYSTDISVRLIKLHDKPYLCFSIFSMMNKEQTTSNIVHHVPVELLSAMQLDAIQEPMQPDPDVHIMLPPLVELRPQIDRMKNLSNFVFLWANMCGQLKIMIETDMVKVATFYSNLKHPPMEGAPPPVPDPNVQCTVKVDVKKFSKFLYSHQVSPRNVVCCMTAGESLVLHVLLGDDSAFFMTYYLPIIVD